MVYDILRVTKKKKQGFTRFLENTFLENPQGRIKFTTPTFLGLRNREFFGVSIYN